VFFKACLPIINITDKFYGVNRLGKDFRNSWNAYRKGVLEILPLYRLDETRDVCIGDSERDRKINKVVDR